MGTARLLLNAPIREALIDIQFVPEGAPDVAAIAAECVALYGGASSEIWESLVQFNVEPGQAAQAKAFPVTAIGKRIDIADRNQVLQLRPNGFTFSRLPRYQHWEEMSQSGLDAWRNYAGRAGASRVVRVALRYINALDLPLPVENFSDYLEAPPPVPNGIPQGIGNFLTRLVVPKGADLATITQISQGTNSENNALRVTVDIEIVTTCGLLGEDFEGLAEILERQRIYKNEIFFAHLTDKTLEMYE